jgi:hypothetical protein
MHPPHQWRSQNLEVGLGISISKIKISNIKILRICSATKPFKSKMFHAIKRNYNYL